MLIKPEFTAPNRLFGPVRTILFILMGTSLFLVTRDGLQEKDKPAMRYFLIQLFLNILWSILFFYVQSPLLAFIEIIILWIFILVTSMEFYRANKKS
jgi:tryptophan-rich sensory protein